MSDLLEQGPPERRARRGWVLLAVAVLLGAVFYSITRGDDEQGPAASSPPTPSASPAPAIGALGTETGTPWPTRPGLCDSEALLPRLTAPQLEQPTGLRVLVGGAGVRVVDVDARAVTPIPGADGGADRGVTDLVAANGGAGVLIQECAASIGPGFAARVTLAGAGTFRPLAGQVDTLMSDGSTAWGYRTVGDSNEAVVLRPLDGGRSIRMPRDFTPYAVTKERFVGAVAEPATAQELPRIATVPRTGAREAREIGRGYILAANDEAVVLQGECETDCVIRTVSYAGLPLRRFQLPAGTRIASEAVLSPDEELLAFQLARARPDPRYALDHPGTPSDVAVMDLLSGDVTVLEGLELAPKSWIGLDFSADSRALAVTINEGSHAELLVWRRGSATLEQVPVRLPGPLLYGAPVLVVSDD
jgi:hypothetical protein